MRRAWAREEETEMKASFAASMQRGHLCSSCFLLARLARALFDIYNVFYNILHHFSFFRTKCFHRIVAQMDHSAKNAFQYVSTCF